MIKIKNPVFLWVHGSRTRGQEGGTLLLQPFTRNSRIDDEIRHEIECMNQR
ncbi:hypothetical protein HanXRQr2_Chr04g0191291 [Helianthus annuus]|uniref:Uncharacterized protein n=1 Tax=Helianthus annuus TaxID=4232 RepID=A0A9K3JB76_HELAN|nr:hypothetical protein HanXRQr2_Chr04g0191291 [Helianthus annuus]KAJ0598872.1 hypothetical protein HanHA89_Chr04g0170451 [Helianthus annuus]